MSSCVTGPERPVEEPKSPPKPSQAMSPPSSDYDEWEMEERLRHLDRIYARSTAAGSLRGGTSRPLRIDAAHLAAARESATRQVSRETPGWTVRLGRLALALGLAVTVCGGSLLAWAHFGPRPDLWATGLPIAVVGQILLLIGIVLQLDAVGSWSSSTRESLPGRGLAPSGDINFRFDPGTDGSRQLSDLNARLDELTRKLEDGEKSLGEAGREAGD